MVLVMLSGAGALLARPAAAIPLILLILVLVFFRDPIRRVPDESGAIVSPADGRVVEVAPAREESFLKAEAIRISIFLSIVDVHVQRAPIAGEIKFVQRAPGRYLDARDSRSGSVNESRTVGIEAEDAYRVTLRQVAGKVARRIVGWEERGANLVKGQRVGMIRFGSRVELYLPLGTEVIVRVGQHI